MLDDRVASAARRRLQPEPDELIDGLALLPLAQTPGSAARRVTTPTDKKCPPHSPLAKNSPHHQHEALERGDRWRQVRTRMRRLLRGDCGGSSGRSTGEGPVTMLHRDFWLEALDDQHRYGCYLRAFHKAWKLETSADDAPVSRVNASFFCWLDSGAGRALDLPECSHEELRRSQVTYCSYEERRRYELRFVAPSESRRGSSTRKPSAPGLNGHTTNTRGSVAEYAESHALVHTDERSKWIFVVDLAGRMYLGRKRKGRFHHSSFVAGAPVAAAGKVVIKLGRVLAIEPHSGHFKPKMASLDALRALLARHGVDVDAVAFVKPKKWAGDWPFPEMEESVDLDDFASDTDDGGGGNAFFGRLGAAEGNEAGDEDEQWPPASP